MERAPQRNDLPENDVAARESLPIADLQNDHQQILLHALENVWHSTATQLAYAQILDGIPVPDLCIDKCALQALPASHPAWTKHNELCSGVAEKLQKIRQELNLTEMRLDLKAMRQYQPAPPHSRAFNTRLIELVARAIHQFAVILFEKSQEFHNGDAISTWVPPEDVVFWRINPDGPLPTWFVLNWYKDASHYPNGSADVVGYWAENMILGGVVLFNRRKEDGIDNAEEDVDSVYFHSQYHHVTYRIYKLLDSQKKRLLDFLLAKGDSLDGGDAPLPILADDENRTRVDPEEPIARTGIYRDIWERRPLPDDAFDLRTKDVFSSIDYLSHGEWVEAYSRALGRMDEIDARLYPDRPPLL